MILITPGKNKNDADDILERLRRLSLSFGVVHEEPGEVISLTEGSAIISGRKAIDSYLDELEDELRKWHYCSC